MDTTRNIQQVGKKYVVSLMKGGVRQRVKCGTLDQALAERARLELTTAEMPADQWTVGHALDVVNKQVWAKSRNADAAGRNGKYAVDFFGKDTLLDSITTENVDAYIEHLREQSNKDSTINRKLAAFSKLVGYARRRNKMRSNPFIERQKENAGTNGRMCFLSKTEEEQVIEWFAVHGWDCHADAVGVLIDTGLRSAELWNLTAKDVDLGAGTLTIWKSKSDMPRVIPMTERVKRILTARISDNPGRLFPKGTNSWMIQQWNKVREEMGRTNDPEFIPYALRHTCASRLVQRGVRIEVVQKWLGHSSIQMTLRYARLNPQNLMDAVKVLES